MENDLNEEEKPNYLFHIALFAPMLTYNVLSLFPILFSVLHSFYMFVYFILAFTFLMSFAILYISLILMGEGTGAKYFISLMLMTYIIEIFVHPFTYGYLLGFLIESFIAMWNGFLSNWAIISSYALLIYLAYVKESSRKIVYSFLAVVIFAYSIIYTLMYITLPIFSHISFIFSTLFFINKERGIKKKAKEATEFEEGIEKQPILVKIRFSKEETLLQAISAMWVTVTLIFSTYIFIIFNYMTKFGFTVNMLHFVALAFSIASLYYLNIKARAGHLSKFASLVYFISYFFATIPLYYFSISGYILDYLSFAAIGAISIILILMHSHYNIYYVSYILLLFVAYIGKSRRVKILATFLSLLLAIPILTIFSQYDSGFILLGNTNLYFSLALLINARKKAVEGMEISEREIEIPISEETYEKPVVKEEATLGEIGETAIVSTTVVVPKHKKLFKLSSFFLFILGFVYFLLASILSIFYYGSVTYFEQYIGYVYVSPINIIYSSQIQKFLSISTSNSLALTFIVLNSFLALAYLSFLIYWGKMSLSRKTKDRTFPLTLTILFLFGKYVLLSMMIISNITYFVDTFSISFNSTLYALTYYLFDINLLSVNLFSYIANILYYSDLLTVDLLLSLLIRFIPIKTMELAEMSKPEEAVKPKVEAGKEIAKPKAPAETKSIVKAKRKLFKPPIVVDYTTEEEYYKLDEETRNILEAILSTYNFEDAISFLKEVGKNLRHNPDLVKYIPFEYREAFVEWWANHCVSENRPDVVLIGLSGLRWFDKIPPIANAYILSRRLLGDNESIEEFLIWLEELLRLYKKEDLLEKIKEIVLAEVPR